MYALGPAIIGIADRFRFLADMRDLGDDVIAESTTDPNQPTRHFVEAAQRRGEIDPDLPVQWILTAMNGLGAGRVDRDAAPGRLTRERGRSGPRRDDGPRVRRSATGA